MFRRSLYYSMISLLVLMISCDSKEEIVEPDKVNDVVDEKKGNDSLPQVKIFEEDNLKNTEFGDKLELKCLLSDDKEIDRIEWDIEYVSGGKESNYSFQHVGGILIKKSDVDYSESPLLLLDPLDLDMKSGKYSVNIRVVDSEKNISEIVFDTELKHNSDNKFIFEDEDYIVDRLESFAIDNGVDAPYSQLLLCVENSAVSQRYVSKGSVIWFELPSYDENGYPIEGMYDLAIDRLKAFVYLNKDVEGKDFRSLECTEGSLNISKVDSDTNKYRIEFNLLPMDCEERIVGSIVSEIELQN